MFSSPRTRRASGFRYRTTAQLSGATQFILSILLLNNKTSLKIINQLFHSLLVQYRTIWTLAGCVVEVVQVAALVNFPRTMRGIPLVSGQVL